MKINSEPKIRTVKGVTFLFTNGTLLELDLVESEGDSVDWDTHKDAFIVTIAERKEADTLFYRPKETLTLFKDKIISISHIEREEMERTVEQELLIKKTLQEMGSKSIN